MARETFIWTHLRKPGASGKINFRVRKTQFGDGYSQRVPDGLNHRLETWPLTFEGGLELIGPIKEFIEDHEGYKAFDWTTPSGVTGVFVVENYNFVSIGSGLYSVSADFVQIATP